MWFTKSEYSHAALFLEVWGQPFIMDAQKDGIQLRSYEKWCRKYKYKVTAYRVQDGLLDQRAFSLRAASKSGFTGYDYISLLFRHPIGLLSGKWHQENSKERKMTCSEFVAWSYGIKDFYLMSPQKLYEYVVDNGFSDVELN